MSDPWRALARAALRSERRQALAFIALMVVTGVTTVRGYVAAYPSAASRVALTASLGGNAGFQAWYGVARNIETVGGFTTWRLTWMLATLTAVWGLLATTRLVRGEEEAGRRELLLAGPTTATRALTVDLATMCAALLVFVTVFAAAMTWSGLAARSALVMAAGIGAPGLLFAAVGAFLSQLYADHRRALAIGGAAIGASFLLRVAADGTNTLGWLRWTTPLGWAENLRPFAGSDLTPLLALAGATAFFVILSFVALGHRNFGDGLIALRVRSHPESSLLHGVGGFTVRLERGVVAGWTFGIGAFAFVFGLLAVDAARFARSQPNFDEILRRLGIASLATPQSFLGLMFAFFALPIAVFAATQANAARTEEATSRLDSILVLPVSRRRWLATRLVGTIAGAVLIAVIAGLSSWLGAALRHAGVDMGAMVRAGINCLPATVFLFGLAVLCFGIAPRLTSAVSLGSVVVAYLVELVGALAKAPEWVLDLSPFHHLAPVPAAPANVGAAVTITVIGIALMVAGVEAFARRDLIGA
ncbi:MAG TPA: hypothetical protein VGI86_12690 [Acidimicrobiia bacterium]